MKEKLARDMALKRMEDILIDELSGREFWGEMDFCMDDYEALKGRIQDILGRMNLAYIVKNFPVSLTTLMIFLTRFKYNDNFWGLLGEELSIKLKQHDGQMLGACARKTFEQYHFNYDVVKNETRINLEPIMYEACLPPISSLDMLFYLFNYDSRRTFDPQLMIEELIDSRSYIIRKPLLHFLQRFQDDRAVDFLLEIHDAILSTDQMMSTDSQYVESYNIWKEHEKSNEVISHRKKQENQARPYLSFENNGKGLVMVLPYTIMKDEWIEDVVWIVRSKAGIKRTIRCNVFGDEGRRYIKPIVIAVSPDEEYYVSFEDEEKLKSEIENEVRVMGIPHNGAIYFNSLGRQVRSNYIQAPYGTMVVSTEVDIVTENCTTEFQSFPCDTEKYKVISIAPLGQDASIRMSNGLTTLTYTSRPQVEISFEGKTLFSISPENTRMFTDLPKIMVNFEGVFINNLLEVHVGSIVIPVEKLMDDSIVIDTKKLSKNNFEKFGTYSIRVYQGKKFLKQAEFSYVPKIKSDCPSMVFWPTTETRKEYKKYRFERIENWELEFTNCPVRTDENHYIVECPPDIGSIQGSLKSHTDKFSFQNFFEIPVNPLEIRIVNTIRDEEENSTDKISRVGLNDFNENNYWISIRTFGEYKDSNYKVSLVTVNGIEQSVELGLAQNGCGNMSLTCFYDTLNSCPLPAEIVLCCNEDEKKRIGLIAITEKLLIQIRPRFTKNRDYLVLDVKDEGKDVTLRKFGYDRIELNLSYSDSKLSKSGTTRGLKFPEPLGVGFYTVTEKEGIGCFDFEDDEIIPSFSNDTLFVTDLDTGQGETSSFSIWLKVLMTDIFKYGAGRSLNNIHTIKLLENIDQNEKGNLSKGDIEILVALAYLSNSKVSDAKKNELSRIMHTVSDKVLSSLDRYEIIKFLAYINCNKEIFDICMKEYLLMLFSCTEEDTKEVAAKMESNSPELSMMLLMSSGASLRDTLWREKYRDLIGREAIISMLSVPGKKENEAREEQKKFLREQKGSLIKIELNDEIAGDLEPIRVMIEPQARGYKIKFNKAKKPDFGIYFNNIKYVDQYVNWFCLNNNEDCEMTTELRSRMIGNVKQSIKSILDSVKELEKSAEYYDIVHEFDKSLEKRKGYVMDEPLSTNSHPRFFYLQAMAALLALIPGVGDNIEGIRAVGRKYLAEAIEIAPRLCKRDIIMAETFIYLKRKEEKLCR